jgi:hypothetical protein
VPDRPIIVFDVNETLLNLGSLQPTFDRIFSDPAALRLWFANLITYSEALTLNGVYVPFTDIGGAVASPLIGVARAWELVGDRDTGITASIAALAGRERHLGGFLGHPPSPVSGPAEPGERPGRTGQRGRPGSPG